MAGDALFGPGREPHRAARGQIGPTVACAVAPMHVQVGQAIRGQAVVSGEVVHRHGVLKDQTIVWPWLLATDALREIAIGVACHLAGGDELGVEIP